MHGAISHTTRWARASGGARGGKPLPGVNGSGVAGRCVLPLRALLPRWPRRFICHWHTTLSFGEASFFDSFTNVSGESEVTLKGS